MGSPSELSLDYKPNGGKAIMMLPKPFGELQPDQTQKLEDFLARLEEERLKIDAFKRELPLCMQLLNNAMEAYRQQLESHNTNHGPRPVLEEFIPLKQMNGADGSEKATNGAASEKCSWMTSAQLWSQQPSDGTKQHELVALASDGISPKLALDNKQRNGGAFLPFSKEKGKGAGSRPLPDLALASAEVEEKKSSPGAMDSINAELVARRENGGHRSVTADQGKGSVVNPPEGQAAPPPQQPHRKARRCWSPDLHRRFVNALQMLGGSQVATPKQIRELMKVDGLTNDEVKSHLQKYRLHTRRPIPTPQTAASAAAPQLVVLGGIWVPPEYAASAAAAGTALYGAHPGATAHYCAAGAVPQDFYQPQPHHIRHHPPPQPGAVHHRGAIMPYRGGQGSPESDAKGGSGVERSTESIEDGEEGAEGEEEEEEDEGRRSESTSSGGWKGGEHKALMAVGDRDGGEESNGSDVTLKF